MKALRPPREDLSAGSGFDRRDFAPTGTRFPLQQPDRQPSPAGTRPWGRLAVIGGAAVLLVAVLVLLVLVLLRDDAVVAVGAPQDVGEAAGEAADGRAPVAADAVEPAAPTGAPEAGIAVASAPQDAGPVDRVIAPELHGAAAFAVQFANTYLNYDETAPEARARALEAYLAPDLDPQLGWSGEGRQLAVMTVAVDADTFEDGRVSVTVAAQVTGAQAPRWVHLAVPLAQDDRGRWAVVDPPAFVPRPLPGRPDTPEDPPVDTVLSVDLKEGIEELFAEYGSQAGVLVDGVTAPSADIRGLEGQFTFLRLADVRVAQGDDETRQASARVVWDNELTGGAVEQRYTLTLVQASGGWLVTTVEPG